MMKFKNQQDRDQVPFHFTVKWKGQSYSLFQRLLNLYHDLYSVHYFRPQNALIKYVEELLLKPINSTCMVCACESEDPYTSLQGHNQ